MTGADSTAAHPLAPAPAADGAPEPPLTHRLGIDVGGTFTDIVVIASDGAMHVRKVPSAGTGGQHPIEDGIRAALADAGIAGENVTEVVHGTTIATNTILGYAGARTGLLTTRGFRDVLELRRIRVPELYNMRFEPPRPFVERRLRLEVDERVAANGSVLRPLDEASVVAACRRFAAEEVEAVAVSLLHSYRNRSHERRVGEIVRQLLPDVYLSLSVDVLPEIREYERTSTTVVNAYIGPTTRRYLESLREQLAAAGIASPLRVMQSNGGVMDAPEAERKPALLVESGPAAGVIAARRLGARLGMQQLISFDMGGTTAKASLVENGRATYTTEYEVGAGISLSSRLVKGGGHALRMPAVDLSEVGAGGGSIIRVDAGGGLKVGPQSAGAVPGPACYRLGGLEPTLTDANVVLGYLNPTGLAGGSVEIDAGLAADAMRRRVARPLGLDLEAAAYGAVTVAITTMLRAVRAVTTYRGRDPREGGLLAFGGNGPLFAAEMARELGIRRVVVPPAAGLFSAVGLLEADMENHVLRSVFQRAADSQPDQLTALFGELEQEAWRGVGTFDATIERTADLRYAGQSFELNVPVSSGPMSRAGIGAMVEAFEEEHETTYGHRSRTEPVELVTLRVTARNAIATAEPWLHRAGAPPPGRHGTDRRAYFGPATGWQEVPVIDRSDLDATLRSGPFIVEEYDSTILVAPGCRARLGEFGVVELEVNG